MALCVDIADAVTAELNNHQFSLAFTAQRNLLPDYELKELRDLKVTVVPKAAEIVSASRAFTQYDYQVDIGIQKKIGPDVDVELPALLGLVEEITDYLRQKKLAAVVNAIWLKTQNNPLYAREHLAQMRVFTSILTLTYRVMT